MREKENEWISYHIYLPWTGNEFLADFLPPLISHLKAEKQIKRFFFIRYTEGNYHIRLRLQLTGKSQRSTIKNFLNLTLKDFGKSSHIAASEIRFEANNYSREKHYFGHTKESVYAELINEQTSCLSMQMLAGVKNNDSSLLLKFTALIYWLFAFTSFNESDLKRSLEESRDFTEKNKSGESVTNFKTEILLRNLPIAINRMSDAAAKSQNVQQTVRLLKRLKLYSPHGRFVATHAIHLFSNKLGFSLSQESEIYNLLSKSGITLVKNR